MQFEPPVYFQILPEDTFLPRALVMWTRPDYGPTLTVHFLLVPFLVHSFGLLLLQPPPPPNNVCTRVFIDRDRYITNNNLMSFKEDHA